MIKNHKFRELENDNFEDNTITVDNLIKDVYELKNKLYNILPNKRITKKNIIRVIQKGMEFEAAEIHLSGKEKKKVVLRAVNTLINESIDYHTVLFSEEKILRTILEEVAPVVIDYLFMAFKGDFIFKKSKNKFCFCI